MTVPVDIHKIVPAREMSGDSDEDLKLLKSMLEEARVYLENKKWCMGIKSSYFGIGVGGVVAVFLFEIDNHHEADPWVWVIVGDLPTLYISVDGAINPACALDSYAGEMKRWINAVNSGNDLRELAPVEVEPSMENANRLLVRLQFIESHILSNYKNDLSDD